jgi:hypothetical protein
MQKFECYHSSSIGKFFCFVYEFKFQIPIYNNASFDNFDFNNEETHCTPTNSMMHNFLNVPKKWIMKIFYILLP